MATFRGIQYEEDRDSPQEWYGEGEARVTRTLRCDWDDRHDLRKELLGYVSGTLLYLPDRYTAGGTVGGLYARECTVKKVSAKKIIADKNSYSDPYAELTVVYRAGGIVYPGDVSPIDIGPDDGTVIIEESLEPSCEFLTLPTNDLYINSNLVESTGIATPAKVIQMMDWVYTMHYRWYLPNNFETLVGKVNDSIVYSSTLLDSGGHPKQFAAETLLCGQLSANRVHYDTGTSLWTVTFRFTHRAEGWNNFPYWTSTGDLQWGSLTDSSSNTRDVYETADFSGIII